MRETTVRRNTVSNGGIEYNVQCNINTSTKVASQVINNAEKGTYNTQSVVGLEAIFRASSNLSLIKILSIVI